MGFLDPKPQTTAGLDAAVRDKINLAGSATQVALSATYVRFLDTAGNPLTGKLVTITVDTAAGEISDIILEDI